MKLAGAALLLAVLLLVTGQGRTHNLPGTRHNREHAIVHAFCGSLRPCPLGREAVRVARCESGPNLWPYALNGPWPPQPGRETYAGMFQFGSFARSTFGFAFNPWEQARAAHRYFVMAGWSPWQCKP